MKTDLRRQAVTQSLIKDNALDWKNLANREIEENKNLKEQIKSLEKKLENNSDLNILEIDPKRCRNWKYADRNIFELGNIDELSQDIKTNGQLQPVIVRKISSVENDLEYEYEVIAGERRWRACLEASLNLKAIITEEDEAGCLIIQTSENKKKSLSSYSSAIAYQKLITDLGISQNELSRRLNIPKTSFSELMSFNKVPKVVWEAVADMTKVKPKTAAFLALMCGKSNHHLNLIIQLAPKIREGMGTDNLEKLIEKSLSNVKNNKKPLHVFKNKNGEILFRITTTGKIALSTTVLKNVDLNAFSEYLSKYFE